MQLLPLFSHYKSFFRIGSDEHLSALVAVEKKEKTPL
jgi:hypothetical protein